MPPLTIRPAAGADFKRIVLRPEQSVVAPDMAMAASSYEQGALGEAHAAARGDEVVCIFGVMPRWPGHGTAYGFVSTMLRGRDAVAITRAVNRWLAATLAIGEYHRIEAWTQMDPPGWHAVADQWLVDRLGFEFEGVARRFTPAGDDAGIYARVAPCLSTL